jgi:peptidoglycan-associated lipoprotein
MSNFSTLVRFASISALLIVGACTSKPEAVATAPPPASPPAPAPPPPRALPPAPPPVARGPLPGSSEDFRVNVGDTVHFAYDQYAVQDNDKATLQKQATWLARYPNVRVTVEGHCDERGTREYNLALGARRANAVKEYLVSLGVSNARVETISYGKERPICTQSDENCWAQNRRGVTVVTSGANT